MSNSVVSSPVLGPVLAFDTAMGGCSVAVFDPKGGKIEAQSQIMARGQSEMLVPMIQEVMARAGCKMQDLALVVTTVGPGGFTGLRIGLSTARSFGLALNIPVAGVRTTDVLLQMAKEKNDKNKGNNNLLVVLVETKREDFYAQEDGQDPALCSYAILLEKYKDTPVTYCGDAVIRFQAEIGEVWPACWQILNGVTLPDPGLIARMGCDDVQAGVALPPDPLYLRMADVSQSKKPQRVIAE